MTTLSIEQAKELLAPRQEIFYSDTRPKNKYVTWYDKELRCASRGCSCPTYMKFKGIPYCTTHTIRELIKELEGR